MGREGGRQCSRASGGVLVFLRTCAVGLGSVSGWKLLRACRPQGPSSGEARPVILREAVIKSHAVSPALLVPGVGGQEGDGGKTRFSENEGVGTVKGWGSGLRGRFFIKIGDIE